MPLKSFEIRERERGCDIKREENCRKKNYTEHETHKRDKNVLMHDKDVS